MFARCYNQEALDNHTQPTTLLYKSASLHKDGQEKRKRINSTYPIRYKNVMQHYAVKFASEYNKSSREGSGSVRERTSPAVRERTSPAVRDLEA
ncbi:hypothetical protein CISIN_1g034474mg [Citrus sinensis]|uniref:Uncharacterized protein n=1 Tax=Citrus sinensis TaxID=2711 RepID=A0A067ETZ5_CITSI|nr:hypothetical protein CISIN_1g034474mg [Citrus sinensis]